MFLVLVVMYSVLSSLFSGVQHVIIRYICIDSP